MKAVNIEDYYPVAVAESKTTVIRLMTYTEKPVAVGDFCNFVGICKAFDKQVFFPFLVYIKESTAEKRKCIIGSLD